MVNNMSKTNKERPKIGVALGSGGARGLSHIGFLRALVEENIPIDVVTGSSMGAIVGGAFAAGISYEEMLKFTKTLRQSMLIDLAFPTGGGFVKGNKAANVLSEFFHEQKAALSFEKTKIAFGCTAVDLVSGNVVYLTKGRLIPAIRASFSIGGIFRPVRKDNMLLVDGGTLCRVPVRLARELGADFVVGVDCAGPNSDILPSELNRYSKIVKRTYLLMEHAASEKEMNESDLFVSIDQTGVDPLKLKEGLQSVEIGYREGKKAAQQLKKVLKI